MFDLDVPVNLKVLSFEVIQFDQVLDEQLQVVKVKLQFLEQGVDRHHLRILLQLFLRRLQRLFHHLVLVFELCDVFKLRFLQSEYGVLAFRDMVCDQV